MARTNGVKSETSATETSVQELMPISDTENLETVEKSSEPIEGTQDIDEILNSLKTLLSTVEKLQKVRMEVGDIKPLIGRMLDGELVSGEDLEQLKSGVSALARLVRAYSDYQAALVKAQPARNLLDQLLEAQKAN